MAANAKSNVVNLSEHEHARRSISSADSGRMLNDCRDLAMRRLSASLREMLGQIEEDLFQMAETTYDREMQNLYLEVRGKAKEKWPSVEAAFSRNFVEFFNRKMHGELGAAVQSVAVSAMDMKLVEEDDLAESIALQEIATHLRENCEDELGLLGERVAVLLGKSDLDDEENPISPQAVCSALKSACDEIEGGIKIKLVLLKQIEQHVSKALHSVYADLNTEMVRWNVLPELKRGYRRPVGSASASKPQPKPSEEPAIAAQTPAAGQPAPDLFSALQQLVQAQYAGVAFAGGLPSLQGVPSPAGQAGGAALAAVPAGIAPTASDRQNGFLDSLTRLQRSDARVSEQADGLPDLDVALGTINVLRQIKSSDMAQSVGQLDAITIDIVAMLFDFIFDDAKIPDPIKALIGRLQIPVLKVAMLDKSFFSSRTHPARRLLDGISHASIGWSREVEQDDPLYRKISHIVERVQTGFERDVGIFSDLLADLDAFLAEREAQADGVAERSAELIERRENDEIAWVIAGEAVSRRLSSEAPPAVRQFLLDHWQQVLKELYLRHGEEHHAFLDAIATMDELIWSVAPKANSEERKKLVGSLSGLLRAMNTGLDLIGLPQGQRNFFFDSLVSLHSNAVRAGLQSSVLSETIDVSKAGGKDVAEQPIEPPAAERYPVSPQGELFVTRISQDDVQIEEIALIGASPAAMANGDLYRERVAALKRGDWVEFRKGDGVAMRARLSWISPQRGVYLFTSPQSSCATSISPEALAHQFRNGMADIVADEPLFDRAVNGVLGSLHAA
jgi:hypothetical protein